MATKTADTKYKKVTISLRNPEAEGSSGFVGGVVWENGAPTIKHFRFQLDKEVSLPVDFITQLKERGQVGLNKKGERVVVPTYLVEGA